MNKRKAAALVALLVMAVNLLPAPVVRAEETISIVTVTDFRDFTEKCVYDEYSKNKRFVLENDLDLEGAEIKSAEVFCGTFEGGGHSIKNVAFSFEGSNKGLFASLTKDGKISDLNVEGDIKVSEEKKTGEKDIRQRAAALLSRVNITSDELDDGAKAAGGIVGYNEGTIVNCSFGGKINGKRQVGGIVGFNAMTGIVDSCANYAGVTGEKESGGIAGYNEGRIKLSKNEGEICPDANEDTLNLGGICGNSEGAVVMCTNDGKIGGDSFGDNVGGICGKQSGEIRECVNNGSVRGRRSVGGICGRFEPYTDIELSYESAKAAIEEQIDIFKEDMEDARKRIVDFAEEILDGNGILSEVLDRLGIKEGSMSSRLDRLTDSAANMMDNISDASGKLTDTADRIADTADSLNDSELKDKLKNSLDSISDFSDEAKDSIKTVSDSLDSSLESLDDFLDEFDGKGQELTDTINKLNDALDKGQDDVDEIKDRLFSQADDLKENIDNLSDKLDDTHTNLQNMMRTVRLAGGDVGGFFDDIDDALLDLRKELDKTKTSIDKMLEPFRTIRKRVSDKVDEIRATLTPSASPSPSPEARLNSDLGYSVDTDSELEGRYDVEPSIIGFVNDLLFPTAYAENDDDEKVAITDLISTDITIPRLIGGEKADTALIKHCINNAGIEGIEMTGGISGSTGFESSLRPGESITLLDGTKVSADSVLKAVIDSCVSGGDILSKNEYAGGATGKCDIGNIKNTLTTGEIEVEDGSYAGGTAGFMSGEIENCIAINDVEANSYIGGIAGSGRDIKTSYSLARLDGKKDKSGAVAGFASGDVEGTYFIDEGLSGISGANLEGKAEAVPPAQIAVEDGKMPPKMSALTEESFYMESGDLYMPQIKALAKNDAESVNALLQSKSAELARFHFKVSFIDRGKELRSMTVDYGTVLSDDDIPRLTADGAEVPAWDKDVHAPIVRHTKFTAEYNKATTTISTGEEPPLLLVESVFDDGTEVTLIDEDTDREFKGYERGDAYSFTLNKSAYDVIKVHIRDESKKAAKIAVMENGKWTLIDCEIDGSYAVFTVGAPCKFIVLHKESSSAPVVIIFIALAVVCAAGIIILRKVRRK